MEGEELSHASLWEGHVLDEQLDKHDPLYDTRSKNGFGFIKEKLDSALPVTAEESCLAQCADLLFIYPIHKPAVILCRTRR